MATKTTGAEFKAFIQDEAYWTGDAYFEDELLLINGVPHHDDCDLDYTSIEDAASITIEGGVVHDSPNWAGKDAPSLESFFKRWKKQRETQTLVIEFNKSRFGEVKEALKGLGITIKTA